MKQLLHTSCVTGVSTTSDGILLNVLKLVIIVMWLALTANTHGLFLPRDAMLSAVYATAIPSVCLSVRPSVTRVDQSKTVEAKIMQFSPYSSPIPLVFDW